MTPLINPHLHLAPRLCSESGKMLMRKQPSELVVQTTLQIWKKRVRISEEYLLNVSSLLIS